MMAGLIFFLMNQDEEEEGKHRIGKRHNSVPILYFRLVFNAVYNLKIANFSFYSYNLKKSNNQL